MESFIPGIRWIRIVQKRNEFPKFRKSIGTNHENLVVLELM